MQRLSRGSRVPLRDCLSDGVVMLGSGRSMGYRPAAAVSGGVGGLVVVER